MKTIKAAGGIRQATERDALAIAELEAASWPGPLQANDALVRRRFEMGHTMIVAEAGSRLIGAICFVATDNEPLHRDTFPRTFSKFSSIRRSEPPRSLYTYSLCVRPEYRGTKTVNGLLRALIDHGKRSGVRWLVGDGRCPSYAGALIDTPDTVQLDPKFRESIDQWMLSGNMPVVSEITRDPLLRFYHRTLGCQFLHLMPNFLPEDTASGGFRVIFAIDLKIQA